MSRRLQRITPSELTAGQRELYEQIAGGPRSAGPQVFTLVGSDGALEGPFNAMLLNPNLGNALQRVGSAIRYEGALSARCRELAILAVAHVWRSEFEIYAHERVARQVDLTPAELMAVRDGAYEVLTDPTERAVTVCAAALARTGDLDDRHHAAVVDALGDSGLFELSTLVGYYATLALQLRLFRVPAPADGA